MKKLLPILLLLIFAGCEKSALDPEPFDQGAENAKLAGSWIEAKQPLNFTHQIISFSNSFVVYAYSRDNSEKLVGYSIYNNCKYTILQEGVLSIDQVPGNPPIKYYYKINSKGQLEWYENTEWETLFATLDRAEN